MIIASNGVNVQVMVGIVMSNNFYSWTIYSNAAIFTVGTTGQNITIAPTTATFVSTLKIS